MIIKAFNELSLNELYQILSLRNEVFIVEQACIYQDIDGKDELSFHAFTKSNEIITSYARILPIGISYKAAPSIGRVLVKENYRNKGLARKLMHNSMDFIYQEMKQDKILISAQEYLIPFYKSLGFVKVSDMYLEDDIPHVKMEHTKN